MKKLSHFWKYSFVYASLLLMLANACTQKGFLSGKSDKNSIQSASLETSTKAGDRPVDTGAGVPGYLVGCSLFTVQDENVQVGCNLTDASGTKIPTAADAWTRYDIRLPNGAPYGVAINKTVASTPLVWDVNFNFKGADKVTLSEIARNSIYGYVYSNAAGQTVRIETVALPPPTPVAPPTTTTNTCLGGALVDGVCFVPVEISCTDYCSKASLLPHPYLINRFGAGPDTDSDLNKQACHDLYAKIRGNQDWDFGDTRSIHGWGCFEEISGRVVYDQTDTDPFEYPRIGDRRICGCQ